MGSAAELARKYLQEKQIPIIFETMMTGLMYNKPDDPVDFMLRALHSIRRSPNQKVTWDMFVENPPPPLEAPPSRPGSSRRLLETRLSAANIDVRKTPPPKSADSGGGPATKPPTPGTRPSSVLARLRNDVTLDRPIVLLFGGPGGAKTSVAAKVCEMMDDPVAHIVMSRAIQNAMEKYQMHNEWRDAALKFESGAAIPSNLALAVLKAELASRKDDNSIILLEGYPKDLNQVEDFENEVRRIDKAVIIDYDEDKLKSSMIESGLSESVVDARLNAYKNQTLPTAKYFDDKLVLQLIPGEQEESLICDQLRNILINVLYPVEATVIENAVEEPLAGAEPLAEEAPPTVEVSENREPNENLSKEANVILVVGAPGSLKAEYCKKIVQQYDGFVHLSMGGILREGIKQNPEDENWLKLLEHVQKGDNVPVELCRDIMYQAMYEYPTAFGFVIEGYPRDVPQAQDFERTIDRIDLVLLIDCTEQFCMNTLRQRTEGQDDSRRIDDTVQAVKSRIANFKQHTLPMLKYFDEKGKLRVVEGDKGVDVVYQDVAKIVEEIFIPQESTEGKSLESSKNSKK